MLGEVDGPMNFNSFLAMFGEKLNGTDEEQMVFEAFKLLDDKGQGQITKAVLKEMLTANGRPADRLTEAEVSTRNHLLYIWTYFRNVNVKD